MGNEGSKASAALTMAKFSQKTKSMTKSVLGEDSSTNGKEHRPTLDISPAKRREINQRRKEREQE